MTALQQAFAKLDTFVNRQMKAAQSPGLALAVTDRGGLLHLATYGFSDLAAQRPVTPETLFEIGSISKSCTAIALLQMVEAGKVDLHVPVSQYLPWFHVPSGYGAITLHHLLSHTGGIISGTDFSGEAQYEAWALRESEAASPPGSFYHYSNVGYKVLGLVLEAFYGQAYPDIIRKQILEPLGMEVTEPAITHGTRQRLAVGYEHLYDDRPSHSSQPLVPATWLETATADGSIATTAADLAAYLRMLINEGQGPQERIVSPESFRLMTQPVIEPPEGDVDHGTFYGYGLNICDLDGGHVLISHGGGMVGYCAHILADPEDGLGVAVLINGPGEPGKIAGFALALLRAAYHDKPPIALPDAPEPTTVRFAGEYAGTYRSHRSQSQAFTLEVQDGLLLMHTDGEQIALEQRGDDRFYVPHPDWSLFLLCFGRQVGRVVEAFHGSDWYRSEGYAGPRTFHTPPAWSAYPGHYRSHNPWYSNFRVVLRKETLIYIPPWGTEEVLVPLGEGLFRIGADERSPETLRFDTKLNGHTLRANLSGCDCYRTFTP